MSTRSAGPHTVGTMKMNLSLIALATALFSLGASACSYFVDQEKAKTELTKIALLALGEEKAEVINATFSFFESRPTLMCPEEMTYVSEVEVQLQRDGSTCRGLLKATKVEPWGALADKFPVRYEVAGLRAMVCN